MELGDLVTEKITGFEGVVEALAFHLHSATRIGLRSRQLNKDGRPQDIVWVDDSQLKVTEIAIFTPTKPVTFAVRMGDRVKDEITRSTGIVVGMSVWVNGCVKTGISTGEKHEGNPVEDIWFAVQCAELVEKAVIKCEQPAFLQKLDNSNKPVTRSTGGPQNEAPAFRDCPGC